MATFSEGYICPDCRQEQGSAARLVAHHQEEHSHVCPHCNVGLPSPADLVEHFTAEHSDKELQQELEPAAVRRLKAENLLLLREIRLQERRLQERRLQERRLQEEEEEELASPLSQEELEVIAANSPLLLAYCQRMEASRRVEVTVARQLLGEAEERGRMAGRRRREGEERREEMAGEREEVVAAGDRQLAERDGQILLARQALGRQAGGVDGGEMGVV